MYKTTKKRNTERERATEKNINTVSNNKTDKEKKTNIHSHSTNERKKEGTCQRKKEYIEEYHDTTAVISNITLSVI